MISPDLDERGTAAPRVDQVGGTEADVDLGGLDAGARDGDQDGVRIGARYLVA